MLSPTKKVKHARLTTLLVLIIMTLCLSQRAGFHVSCVNTSQVMSEGENSQASGVSKLASEKCDASEHMLQVHSNAIDFVMLFVVMILGSLFFYPTLSSKLSPLNLSRAPPRPLFLIFCNFRE